MENNDLKQNGIKVTGRNPQQIIQELLGSYAERQIEKEKLLSNDNYLKWLEKFTNDYDNFFDNSWLYNPEELSQEDLSNVQKLDLLYSGIEEYAERNYILPTSSDYGDYYSIIYNNVGYQIGLINGQCLCNRMDSIENIKYINFTDVIDNKKCDNVDSIKGNLFKLHCHIKQLYNEGVPLKYISKVVDETLSAIEKEEELKIDSHEKKLKK